MSSAPAPSRWRPLSLCPLVRREPFLATRAMFLLRRWSLSLAPRGSRATAMQLVSELVEEALMCPASLAAAAPRTCTTREPICLATQASSLVERQTTSMARAQLPPQRVAGWSQPGLLDIRSTTRRRTAPALRGRRVECSNASSAAHVNDGAQKPPALFFPLCVNSVWMLPLWECMLPSLAATNVELKKGA